jgi:hypothetical protein
MTPLIARMLKHAFLSGFVAARNIPAHEESDGNKAWVDYEPYPKDLEKLLRDETVGIHIPKSFGIYRGRVRAAGSGLH